MFIGEKKIYENSKNLINQENDNVIEKEEKENEVNK